MLRRLGAAWRAGQHLIPSLAGIVEPPQFALPSTKSSKVLGQAHLLLGAALAGPSQVEVFVVMERIERSHASLALGTLTIGTKMANDTSMDVLPEP